MHKNWSQQWDAADAKDEAKDIPPFPYQLEELHEFSSKVIESVPISFFSVAFF